MAIYLPSAGDYEAALQMMGKASSIEAFERGRDRSIQRQAAMQTMNLQRQTADAASAQRQQQQAFTASQLLAEEYGGAGYEGMLGGGGARGGQRTRRSRGGAAAGGLAVAPVTSAEAIGAMEKEALSGRMARQDMQREAQQALVRQQIQTAKLQRQFMNAPLEAAEQSQLSSALNPWMAGGKMEEGRGGDPAQVGEAIAAANALQADESLRGQRLRGYLERPRTDLDVALEADPAAVAAQPPTELQAALQPYVAKEGDYLAKIAEEEGVAVDELVEANKELLYPGGKARRHPSEGEALLSGKNLIYVGEEIVIPGREVGGPVDDTGGEAGVGTLASIETKLLDAKSSEADLRSAVTSLRKGKRETRAKNPFEEFGKPATYMPSIRSVSYAAQMAKNGDPSLFAQMIGRSPYPSEIRRLDALVSDYQDFAGGVRTKATEITRNRALEARKSEDAQELAQATRFAGMARQLLEGAMRNPRPGFIDFAVDSLGGLWAEYPADAQKLLERYISMGYKEQDRFIAEEKARRKRAGAGGGGESMSLSNLRTARTASASERDRLQGQWNSLINLMRKPLEGGINPKYLSKETLSIEGFDTQLPLLSRPEGTADSVWAPVEAKWLTFRNQLLATRPRLFAAERDVHMWSERLESRLAGERPRGGARGPEVAGRPEVAFDTATAAPAEIVTWMEAQEGFVAPTGGSGFDAGTQQELKELFGDRRSAEVIAIFADKSAGVGSGAAAPPSLNALVRDYIGEDKADEEILALIADEGKFPADEAQAVLSGLRSEEPVSQTEPGPEPEPGRERVLLPEEVAEERVSSRRGLYREAGLSFKDWLKVSPEAASRVAERTLRGRAAERAYTQNFSDAYREFESFRSGDITADDVLITLREIQEDMREAENAMGPLHVVGSKSGEWADSMQRESGVGGLIAAVLSSRD